MKRIFEWKGLPYICLPMRLYIGGVFLYACWHKIINPSAFALDVATYQILPLYLINAMAIILPWVELVSGVLMIVGWRTKSAALLISAMMIIFIMAVSIALAKGIEMSCGCFASQSIEKEPISILTIFRDVAWLLIALFVLFFDSNPIGVDRLINFSKAKRK